MIFNIRIKIINVEWISHRCLFNEQICFFDEDIDDVSMFSMCSGLLLILLVVSGGILHLVWTTFELTETENTAVQLRLLV